MFKVIVAGTTEFSDYNLLKERLDFILSTKKDIEIVSGMAPGADTLGEKYALEKGYGLKQFPADWDRLKKKAGPLRNIEMANYADACIVFWDDKSRGSKHMIETANKKGLYVRIVHYLQPLLNITEVKRSYDLKEIPKGATLLCQKIERNGIVDLSVPTYDILKPNEKMVYFFKTKK